MSVTLKSLGIDRLSVEERILLAEEIWDSIEDQPGDFQLTEPQRRDLEGRLDASRANPKSGLTWDEVKVRLSAQQ